MVLLFWSLNLSKVSFLFQSKQGSFGFKADIGTDRSGSVYFLNSLNTRRHTPTHSTSVGTPRINKLNRYTYWTYWYAVACWLTIHMAATLRKPPATPDLAEKKRSGTLLGYRRGEWCFVLSALSENSKTLSPEPEKVFPGTCSCCWIGSRWKTKTTTKVDCSWKQRRNALLSPTVSWIAIERMRSAFCWFPGVQAFVFCVS